MVSFSEETIRKLTKLSAVFCNSLPERFVEIRKAANEAQKEEGSMLFLERMKLLVHKLNGAAGSFGLEDLSAKAAALEALLEDFIKEAKPLNMEDWRVINQALLEMEEESLGNQAVELCDEVIEIRSPAYESPSAANGSSHKRILYFADSEGVWVQDLISQFGIFNYEVYLISKIERAVEALRKGESQVLLVDAGIIIAFPEVKKALVSLRNELFGRVIIIFISHRDDFDTRLDSVRAGGEAFFLLPVDTSRLIDKIETFLSKKTQTPYHVLIVDDDPEQVAYYALILQQEGMITSVATDPMKVITVLVEAKPEIILMDMYMPGCSGLELAAVIRQMDTFISTPIIFLSQEGQKDKQLEAIRLGADDFLMKPVQPDHLVSTIINRAERTRGMRFFMERDSLTGLLNHTNLKETLNREIIRADRCGSTLCFAMIDADKFKVVNDTYGHLTGDRVLKSLARLLQERLRRTDIIGRYGGEEFGVILLNTTPDNAGRIMDTIRDSFSRIRQRSEAEEEFFVTFSCGISSYPEITDSTGVTAAADKALYEAKEAGRNRVVLYQKNL